MRTAWALAVLLGACRGGYSPTDASPVAPHDAGASEADSSSPDSAADAGSLEPPRGEILADDLCPGSDVALSSTGEVVAYVSCAGRDPALAVRSVFSGDTFDLGPADPSGAIELSPDDVYVVYRSGGAVHVRHALGITAPLRIAESEPSWLRFVRQPNGWFILTLTSRGSYQALLAYRESTSPPFGTRNVLIDGSDLDPGLVFVDETSGQIVCGLGSVYARLSIEGGPIERMAFGPADGAILPGALSGTHALVRDDNGLSYRSLTRPSEQAELLAGALGGEMHVATYRGAAWVAAFGRILRIPLEWPTAVEPVRTVDALGLRFTPAHDRLLYATSTSVESITPSGSTATLLVDRTPRMPFSPELSPTGRQIALVLAGGSVVLTPPDEPGSARELRAAPLGGAVRYDGLGDRLLYLEASDERGHANVLRGVGAFVGEPYTLAWDVEGYWPVPGSMDVLYARRTTDGMELRLLRERGGR